MQDTLKSLYRRAEMLCDQIDALLQAPMPDHLKQSKIQILNQAEDEILEQIRKACQQQNTRIKTLQ